MNSEKLGIEELITYYKKTQSTGVLFIVSGPSGAGKTLLCNEALKIFPRLICSTSYTTREKRPQEVDGKDYFFLTAAEFEEKIRQGNFLEWAKVHNNYYGTDRSWILDKLEKNWDIILDIDVQGARQIYDQNFPCCLIFVVPPSDEILISRLKGRDSDSQEAIARRLKTAQEEIKYANTYQYLIVNDKLPEAVERLSSIIRARKSLLNPPQNSFKI